LNRKALELRRLGRFAEAADRLRQAIEIEDRLLPPEHPKRAHRRNNLSIVLMLDGQLDAAAAANAEAWELKATVSEGGHDMTSARILFARIALDWFAGAEASVHLGQLRTLLERPDLPCHGGINAIWNAVDILERLREKLAPEQADLLASLVDAMNDRTKLPALDQFPVWRNAEAQPLD